MKNKLMVGDIVDMCGRVPGKDYDYGQILSIRDDQIILVLAPELSDMER